MKTSQARLATPLARRYLTALCSHFTRKIQVEYTDEHGVATFPQGVCELSLDGDVLVLNCCGADDEALTSIERVLTLHMQLFTRRDPVTLEWQREQAEK
ncbi:MAG: DUF2218 domain-containing protein [Rhodocyclaceae bacterium]